MAYNMYDIGPARYQGMQRQQKHDWWNMMMNMFLMSKRMKMTKEEQGREQQRWEAEAPLRQARTQYYQAQAQPQPPKVPVNLQEFYWLKQNIPDMKDKEAMDIAFGTKENLPDWWYAAERAVDMGLYGGHWPTAIQMIKFGKAKDELSPSLKHKIKREKKGDFENFLETAIATIEKRGSPMREEVDEKTGEISQVGRGRIDNLQKALDEIRRIQAKVQVGDATEEDKARAMKIYGNLGKIEKEGFYWDKDEFGYRKGERKIAKGAIWEYIGNNQWQMVQQ